MFFGYTCVKGMFEGFPMRVMLVEPSKIGLKLMARMIEDMGHSVCPFFDGEDALQHLHEDANLDVVMTSFEVPGVSGIQLCWEARIIANKGRPIYVIAMSSSNDTTHLVEALDSGADDFIRKPPDKIELEARLRAAERMNQARRELVRWATHDALTSLLNRRALFQPRRGNDPGRWRSLPAAVRHRPFQARQRYVRP